MHCFRLGRTHARFVLYLHALLKTLSLGVFFVTLSVSALVEGIGQIDNDLQKATAIKRGEKCARVKETGGHQPILVSIVVSIPACHAGDRGSIPRRGGAHFF